MSITISPLAQAQVVAQQRVERALKAHYESLEALRKAVMLRDAVEQVVEFHIERLRGGYHAG